MADKWLQIKDTTCEALKAGGPCVAIPVDELEIDLRDVSVGPSSRWKLDFYLSQRKMHEREIVHDFSAYPDYHHCSSSSRSVCSSDHTTFYACTLQNYFWRPVLSNMLEVE